MKNGFLLFLAGTLLISNVSSTHAQSSPTIRARFTAIERAIPSCKVIQRDTMDYAPEGSGITAYFKRGEPQKLVAQHYGERWRATEEYYFWHGQLFFVLRTVWGYEKSLGELGAPGNVTRGSQERLYFQNGKLTRRLSNKNSSVGDAALIYPTENEYLRRVREFLLLVKEPKKEL